MNTPYLINCDVGESYGNFSVGDDSRIIPLIHAANIACGMHGGDPYHIERTINMALEHQVIIGAHPGYPDIQGFGRRIIPMKEEELSSFVKYQICALKGLVEANGGVLDYVKPHGALYNHMAKNQKEAQVVINAIKSIDPNLKIMGLAGSHLKKLVTEAKMDFIAEAFADRAYENDLSLRSRSLDGALIKEPEKAIEQVISILKSQKVTTYAGLKITLEAESFCIHGDNPAAFLIAQGLNQQFKSSHFAS
jgi:UPF0271 protein